MKVGLIGLGNMGAAMAANLLRAVHSVTVYNRTASKADALIQQGAKLATEVAIACRGDALITMLADDHAVESIAFADSGLLERLDPRTIHVSM
jgi:3-hydroxyisobutyrate dehydrogenase-like beta-hydroxyacid dehydrogenase